MALTGNETLQVLGQDGAGHPAASTQQTTTAAIAALASQEVEGVVTVSNTTSLVIINTTTLTPIPGLAVPLVAGGTYSVVAALPVASLAGAGVQLAFNTPPGGTLTASSINVNGQLGNAAGTYAANIMALGSSLGTTAAIIFAELNGVIQVNAAGTLDITAGQQAANASSTTIQANGFLQVTRIS